MTLKDVKNESHKGSLSSHCVPDPLLRAVPYLQISFVRYVLFPLFYG